MFARLLRLTASLALLAALAWLGRRALTRWVQGPPVEPSAEVWPAVDDTARTSPTVDDTARTSPAPVRADATPATPATPPATAAPAAWVEASENGCPATHPVKAKQRSMLYHLPGMLAYERTRPDRCYASPEAAEADGFVRAKR